MRKNKIEIEEWVDSLNSQQAYDLLKNLVVEAVDTEQINFWSDQENPSCAYTGEPIVATG